MLDVVVDADVLAYRCLAAATKVTYMVVDNEGTPLGEVESGIIDGKSGPKRAKELAEELGGGTVEKYSEEPPLEHVIHNIKEVMTTVYEQYPNGEVFPYLSADGPCWRHSIYEAYKGQRPPRPRLLPEVRDYLLESMGAEIFDDYEADDAISIHVQEAPQWAIVSNDKDFKQIPGLHFDPFSKEEDLVSPQEAEYNLWIQMLMGDNVDNIVGIPGIGKAKAAKILGEMPPEEYPEIVLLAYEERDLTKEDMLLTWRLVKLLETEEEQNELPYWYDQV